MGKFWLKGALPDGCMVEKPKLDEILQYGMSGEVLEQRAEFGQWLLGIVKHGGPKVDGKPLYDPDTAMRIWEAFIEKTSGKD